MRLVHSAHAAHAGVAGGHRGFGFFDVAEDALGGEEHAGDAGGVLQGHTGHLGGVDDTALEEVLVFLGAGVVAVVALAILDFIDNDAAFQAGVLDNHAQRLLDGATDNLDAELLVLVLGFHGLELLGGADEGGAATGDDTLFDSCAGGVQGVVEAVFLLFHLDFRSGADVDDCHAAGQLGQTLLQLLAVVVAGGLLDLSLDLTHAGLDGIAIALAADDGGVVLVDADLLALAEHAEVGVLELVALLLADDGATGEDGDVLEHLLAAVAEAGGLDGGNLQAAAQAVDHEGGKSLALDILSDDEERTAGVDDFLEHGQEVLHGADLLVVDKDIGVVVGALHLFGVGDEVGADVAAVELHTLDDLDGGVDALGVLDGDDAVLGHFLHGLGDDVTDGKI